MRVSLHHRISLLVLLLLASQSLCQLTTPCLKGNFTGISCGDCLKAYYAIKPTEQSGLSFVRCLECDYFVPNDHDLTESTQIKHIGKYGCTWAKFAFFTKHPLILMGTLLLILGLILMLVYLFKRKHRGSGYHLRPPVIPESKKASFKSTGEGNYQSFKAE